MSGAKPAVRRQADVLSPFAGRLSTLHGYTNYKRAISEDHLTLAEALQRGGYDTFAVSTNPHVTIRNGLFQGFDTCRRP